jgi:hypothetical protein
MFYTTHRLVATQRTVNSEGGKVFSFNLKKLSLVKTAEKMRARRISTLMEHLAGLNEAAALGAARKCRT